MRPAVRSDEDVQHYGYVFDTIGRCMGVSDRHFRLVVPCYNEADRLDGDQFVQFAQRYPHVHFLFVDDGSSDDTKAMLTELCARRPESLGLLALQKNRGKGEAVRQGMLAAMVMQPEPMATGFWDADLATPLEAINVLGDVFAQRPDIDMVFGSRVNLLGREVHRQLMRHYIGRVFATAASAVLRLPIYDTQCGAKLFRATDELRTVCADPFLSRWIFDVEMIARYQRLRRGSSKPAAREIIYELPLLQWRDVKGSKLTLPDFFVVGLDLMRIQVQYFS